MKKKLLSMLLVAAMFLALIPTAFAASDDAITAANALYQLGLFKGTGTNADGTPNFDLDRAPTRNEAVTMLVRLLGKENEAVNGVWNIPFTDVAAWAKPYVGYAYANGLTTGTSATSFGGDAVISASQYITFVLRALGYESGTDFQWDKSWELSDSIGMTNGQYTSDHIPFLRGDVAIISNNALATELKNTQYTLAASLNLSAPVNPEPAKNELSENDMKSLRLDILDCIVTAWSSLADGYDLMAQSADWASYGLYSTATSYAKSAQQEFIAAETEWKKAIELCGDYAENANMKSLLQAVVNALSQFTSYHLIDGDENNLWNFMQTGMNDNISDALSNLNTAVDEWLLQLSE